MKKIFFSIFLMFCLNTFSNVNYNVFVIMDNNATRNVENISKGRELLPLLEAGASWEVSAFVSQIYLPSSSDSPCPVFLFPNISTFLFQHLLYSVPHCNLYQFQSHNTHIYNFFLIISVSL